MFPVPKGLSNKDVTQTRRDKGGWDSIAQSLAYLLLDPAVPSLIPSMLGLINIPTKRKVGSGL